MAEAYDDRLDPRLRWLIGVVLLGGLLGILSSTMAAVAVDTLATAFEARLSTVGWLTSGFLLAVTVAIPFATWAIDRFGSRRLWLAGLTVFVLASLGAGLAWDIASLIGFRVLQGIGAGILDPLVLTILARASGPARAGRVMGLMAAVMSFGPVLGPVLGGVVVQGLSWRWMFLLTVAVGLIALGLAWKVMPPASDADDGSPTANRLDVIGLALLGPGVAAVVLAFTNVGRETAVFVGPVLIPLVIGSALLAGYAVRAARPRRTPPVIDPRLFTRPGFAASVVVMGLVGLGMFSALLALPLYFQQVHHLSVLAAGLLVAPLGVASAVVAPFAGRVSERVGSRGLAAGGAALALLGALLLVVSLDAPPVWTALAGVVLGVGLGGVGPPAMGSLYRTLPAALVPQGSSLLYMLNQLGAAVGGAVVAVLLEIFGATAGYRPVSWWIVAAIAMALFASARLPGRTATVTVTNDDEPPRSRSLQKTSRD